MKVQRQYRVMEEGDPLGWHNAPLEFADRPIRAASAFAEAEFSDPVDWEDEEERIVLVGDVESGEVWRFRVRGNLTVDFDIECDKSFNQQEAAHAIVQS